MTDPVYTKLRYTDLELLLMKKLKEAHKALENIRDGEYVTTSKALYSGSSPYEASEAYYQQLRDCEAYADVIANSLFDDFEDEEYDVLSQS